MFFVLPQDGFESEEERAAARDAHAANFTANYNSSNAVLESLTVEQTDWMLNVLTASVADTDRLHQIIGHLVAYRRYFLGICGCSPFGSDAKVHYVKDHSDPNWMLTGEHSPREPLRSVPAPEPEPMEEPVERAFEVEHLSRKFLNPAVMTAGQLKARPDVGLLDSPCKYVNHRKMSIVGAYFSEHLKYYGLVLGEDSIYCEKCKLPYQTLADRALKEPGVEGCDGCQEIAKRGGGDPWGERG